MIPNAVSDISNVRCLIVAEIMKMIQPAEIERGRPSIDELEKILNSDEQPNIQLRADGSVVEFVPTTTTVGKVADSVMRIVTEYIAALCPTVSEGARDPKFTEQFTVETHNGLRAIGRAFQEQGCGEDEQAMYDSQVVTYLERRYIEFAAALEAFAGQRVAESKGAKS